PERCDLAGRRNLYESQTTAIEQRLVRGEFFAALTENPDWGTAGNPEPCFLLYDSEEIATPPTIQESSTMMDGVELNEKSRAIAYWIRGLKEVFTRIDRAQMIH